ncbi:MAG: 4-alpha-glucanotransferase [Chitinophagaceae bacterium]|nr:4-alpha-glucanotransferase [Chitinophagaceae bacterium]
MRIQITLRFHTRFGQTLHLKSEHPDLQGNTIDLEYINPELWGTSLEIENAVIPLNYQYLLKNDDGAFVHEWGKDRTINLEGNSFIQVIDTWNHAGEYDNVFLLEPFQEVLLDHHKDANGGLFLQEGFTCFKVKAPLLSKNQVVCLLGEGELGNWNTESPILLKKSKHWWWAQVKLNSGRVTYKYGIYNTKSKEFETFESGDNRIFQGAQSVATILHDGFLRMTNTNWKGAGVAIPVFSLRSKQSFGVGEFTDIKLLVDWSAKVGMKLIQLLPVNDTTATHTWQDSYPYAAISAFALHPIFINLEEVAGKKYAELLKPLAKKQKELNALPVVDYEQVMKLKWAALKELYHLQKETLFKDPDYLQFFEQNKHWLVAYAAFSALRDKYGTADFTTWPSFGTYSKSAIDRFVSPRGKNYDDVALHYFIQYHLHLQLSEATKYAHSNGLIVKGDIPIGIYRNSVDAWMEPELYHMDRQAGAPPDDFAVHGQNWGFPTYNWERMAQDGYKWWYKRFVQMGHYFDAFRIDHILGFFRIWSIPLESTQGIMGQFVPSIPVYLNEFSRRGVTIDAHRLCSPYITDSVLFDLFGEASLRLKEYLQQHPDGTYSLKEGFQTQRQIEQYFDKSNLENASFCANSLMDLAANVVLFEAKDTNEPAFHFRFNMEQTHSFKYLDSNLQFHLKELYIDYFFRRQDEHWKKEAMEKLPALKSSTDMLICGEDLGLVPSCVPDVMSQLGILSLEIQRMPKALGAEFFHPKSAPYMSVVTPSTHDMSTIRGWWEEDRAKTQRFFNQELGHYGEAPAFCEAWINKEILLQHFYSPAMWSIFQLQDLLGMDPIIRRESPHEERINIPANPKHYWQYRMHLNLEKLIKEKDFNQELKDMIKQSNRL